MEMKEKEWKNHLATEVRMYRARHRLTQQQFADLCGISRRALQKVEREQNTSHRTQLAICPFIDV